MKLYIILALSTLNLYAKTVTENNIQYQCQPIDPCAGKYKTKIVYKDRIKTIYRDKIVPKEVIVYKDKIVTQDKIILKPERTLVTRIEVKERPVYKKNILSITAVNSKTKLDHEDIKTKSEVFTEREVGVGIMYQRFFTESLVGGLEVDSLETVSASIGFAF